MQFLYALRRDRFLNVYTVNRHFVLAVFLYALRRDRFLNWGGRSSRPGPPGQGRFYTPFGVTGFSTDRRVRRVRGCMCFYTPFGVTGFSTPTLAPLATLAVGFYTPFGVTGFSTLRERSRRRVCQVSIRPSA